MAMVQAFVRPLIAAKGLIINISSLSARTPYCFGSVYCATKGAIDAYSRTLRLELRPFGVRVMVAVTGTVRSNIANVTHRTLLPNSLYEPVRDIFEWRLVFSQNNGTVSTDAYADKLVRAALRSPGFLAWLLGRSGPPKWFWAGGFSTLAWFGSFFGEWLLDWFCLYRFKIPTMTKRLEAAKKND